MATMITSYPAYREALDTLHGRNLYARKAPSKRPPGKPVVPAGEEDTVTISPTARMLAFQPFVGDIKPEPDGSNITAEGGPAQPGAAETTEKPQAGEKTDSAAPGEEDLSREEKQEVQKLKNRDQEVRNHERAHQSAGGQYAGAPSYSYEVGPDGKRYAVGGEVPIDTSPIKKDPQATIQKMQTVRRAALAPAQPSGQDRRVAAQASRTMAQARVLLRQEQSEKAKQPDQGGRMTPDLQDIPGQSGGAAATQTLDRSRHHRIAIVA